MKLKLSKQSHNRLFTTFVLATTYTAIPSSKTKMMAISSSSTCALKARFRQSITMAAFRSYVAEFISTFLFVLVAAGSTISSHIGSTSSSDPATLVAIAMAHAFGLSSAIYIAANISGGHLNPAVTFGFAVGGHISIPTAIFYWVAQLMGSIMACLLLKLVTAGQVISTHAIAEEMTGFGGSVLEGVLTFALVYTVYAAADPRRASPLSQSVLGPIAVGFVVGANVLAAGPFTGGSMNPAYSLGCAMISGRFKNQAVYWVGPLIGAGIAGLVYDNLVFPPQTSSSDGDGSNRGVVERPTLPAMVV